MSGMRYYNCIFFDPWDHRHEEFTLTAFNENDFLIYVADVRSLDELEKELNHGMAPDVLFFSGFWTSGTGSNNEPLYREKFLKLMRHAEGDKRPKSIVFHGTMDYHGVCTQLRDMGYVVAHMPFNKRLGYDLDYEGYSD